MNKKLTVGAAVAVLTLSGGGLAMASSGSSSAQGDGGASVTTGSSPTVFDCNGGKQIEVKNRMVSSPYTFSEAAGAFADVPNAVVTVGGPRHGRDTLVVTFSAETQLTGSTGTQDWIGLNVTVDGVPLQPYTAAGDVMALSGSPTWNMHSATFCGKVGPGKHVVKARTNLADFQTDDTLGGWLDDYTLSVERSE